jgi:hypothetical protein
MVVVLFLLAVFLIAGGGAALFSGYEILLTDRGLPIMISGATILSAGLLLAGCAVLARHLSRIARQLGEIRTGLGDLRAANLLATARPPRSSEFELAEEPAPIAAREAEPEEITEEGAALVVPEPAEPAERPERPAEVARVAEPQPKSEPQEAAVVGRYSSGGNDYTMYADGSIIADTPTGQHRFASLDELKAFVSSGGEQR